MNKEKEVIAEIFKAGTLLQVAERCGFTGSYSHDGSPFVLSSGDCFVVLNITEADKSCVIIEVLFDCKKASIIVPLPKNIKNVQAFFTVLEQQS